MTSLGLAESVTRHGNTVLINDQPLPWPCADVTLDPLLVSPKTPGGTPLWWHATLHLRVTQTETVPNTHGGHDLLLDGTVFPWYIAAPKDAPVTLTVGRDTNLARVPVLLFADMHDGAAGG